LIRGEDVEVAYAIPVGTILDLGPEDLIQLRRADTDELVSNITRGDPLTGTVLLGTDFDNAIGECYVVYTTQPTENDIAYGSHTVHIIEPPSLIEVPGPEASTIQAAIDLVADGGTVMIRPGRYRGSLQIVGKEVHLEGRRSWRRLRRTVLHAPVPRVIVQPEDAVGLINYTEGGGGSIKNLVLRGGHAGIRGYNSNGVLPASVHIEDVRIRRSGRGIAGSFSDLTVDNTAITGTRWHGVSIERFYGTLTLLGNFISNTGGVGLLIYNFDLGPSEERIEIRNNVITYNPQGGIVVAGGVQDVLIENCGIGFNYMAGILLVGAGIVDILDTNINYVFLADTPEHEGLAEGLLVVDSYFVSTDGFYINNAKRSGIYYYYSGGQILNTYSEGGRFGLVLEGSSYPDPDIYPDWEDDSNTYFGAEQDILKDGALPVPEAPSP